jgi:hypothetical protein
LFLCKRGFIFNVFDGVVQDLSGARRYLANCLGRPHLAVLSISGLVGVRVHPLAVKRLSGLIVP